MEKLSTVLQGGCAVRQNSTRLGLQQLREAFSDYGPYRFVILDRFSKLSSDVFSDRVYSEEFRGRRGW